MAVNDLFSLPLPPSIRTLNSCWRAPTLRQQPDRGFPVPQFDLFAHKLQEVAQQLTLLQFAFYTAIDRREMLNTA